jgi:ubiquinone/menaquinone biosynthesis C-methylase UbiE
MGESLIDGDPIHDRHVNEQYGRAGLPARLLEALRAAGEDPDSVTPNDLAPLDQFHVRGREATLELARLAGVTPQTRVLDVGGGLGGPARTLADELGCTVEVLDLTEEYCHAGEMLTALTGLEDRVSFRHGDALRMPYPDTAFDLVWTQHSSMNVAEKGPLYREIRRVTRAGGRLALHEIFAGPVSPIHFPVPWAHDPKISFLIQPSATRALIEDAGFKEKTWTCDTARALEWLENQPPTRSPLNLGLLLGDEAGEMSRNLARNLRERRISVFQSVFERR